MNEGAPVKFRGVTIGSVKRVMVHFNQATNDYAMPVIIELEEKLLRERMPIAQLRLQRSTPWRSGSSTACAPRCKRRAWSPASSTWAWTSTRRRRRRSSINWRSSIPSCPPSRPQIQQLFNNLASLDIKSLQTNLNGLITRLDTTVGELKMADINAGVTNLLASVNRLVTDPDITNALAALRPTLDQYRELGAKVTSKIDPLADSVTNTLAEANRTLAQIRGAGENLRTMLAPDSPFRNDLDQALQQLAGAAQSMSSLARLSETTPERPHHRSRNLRKNNHEYHLLEPELLRPPGPADHIRAARQRTFLTRFAAFAVAAITLVRRAHRLQLP